MWPKEYTLIVSYASIFTVFVILELEAGSLHYEVLDLLLGGRGNCSGQSDSIRLREP